MLKDDVKPRAQQAWRDAQPELTVAKRRVTRFAAEIRDEYREQVEALIQMKASGQELQVAEAAPEAPKVVDLMAALEASVEAAKSARAKKSA